jgi:precorrin-3B C17-methyltransferase
MQKFYVVGIGPGCPEQMTIQAKQALEEADIIAGYGTYIKLVRPLFPDKEYLQNGMTGEVKRCEMALEQAQAGKTVAMISSGDSGIYGMAGLVLELAKGMDIDVVTVPGITAASSGAALLGAPLMHDFAVISLSDRLTEWDLIEKRLHAAASADFNIVLYNPRSKGRPDHIAKAREIFLQYKSAETPVGIVKNIGRDGESAQITTLGEFDIEQVDMFSTVFVGNSQTYIDGNKIVTPRGYLEKQA